MGIMQLATTDLSKQILNFSASVRVLKVLSKDVKDAFVESSPTSLKTIVCSVHTEGRAKWAIAAETDINQSLQSVASTQSAIL